MEREREERESERAITRERDENNILYKLTMINK